MIQQKLNSLVLIGNAQIELAELFIIQSESESENQLKKNYFNKGIKYSLEAYQNFKEAIEKSNWEIRMYELGKAAKFIQDSYTKIQEFDKAQDFSEQHIQFLKQNKKQFYHYYYDLAEEEESKGDYAEAIKIIDEILNFGINDLDLEVQLDCFGTLGDFYYDIGNYKDALYFYEKSLKIAREIKDQDLELLSLKFLGVINFNLNNFQKSKSFLEEASKFIKNNGIYKYDGLFTDAYLYLSYKFLKINYDEEILQNSINDLENIKYFELIPIIDLSFRVYQLVDDKKYLNYAYNNIQKKVAKMEKEFGEKFLTYPIPKAIIEEWEKVSKVKN